jgi:hypothetical protein
MGFIIEFMKCLKKKNIVINLSLRKLVEYSFIKEIIEMLKKIHLKVSIISDTDFYKRLTFLLMN